MTLSNNTLAALALMPDRLAETFRLVPSDYYKWTPASWDGIPGERFSPLGQVCHVRDIEVQGYHVRIARMLKESEPALVSLDSYELAAQRDYAAAEPEEVLAAFRAAREVTMSLLCGITKWDLKRRGTFGEYGAITRRSLVHYLVSHDNQHLACMDWLLGQIYATSDT